MNKCLYPIFEKKFTTGTSIRVGEVIQLTDYQVATKTGPAKCLHCKYEWQAVAPAGVQDLQCPACLTMRGVFIYFCAKQDEEVKMCHICNNTFFQITLTGTLCINCGYYQAKEE